MNAVLAAGAGLVLGVLIGWLVWRALEPVLVAAPLLERQNYRGATLVVGSGLAVVVTVVLVAGGAALVAAGVVDPDPMLYAAGAAVAVSTVGYGLLGIVDDLLGTAAARGFRGHLRALAHGEVTTGAVKLVGGAALGVAVAATLDVADLGAVLRQGLLIAGAANLVNLFDRAPGRALKVTALGWLGAIVAAALTGMAAATLDEGLSLAAPAVAVGAGLVLLGADLAERTMLGDTGANPLGAAVGIAWVLAVGTVGEWVVLGVVVLLNAVSERIGFSRVIDRTGPLRRLDRWGCLPERRAR